jgi:hypothetical protein
MDLRSGQSLWIKLDRDGLVRPALEKSVRCDVLIVGSGISGALIAYHVAELGLNVVVVDRRDIASGSTPASTALLQYDIDTPLVKLRRKLGQKHADAAYKRSRKAVSDMAALVKRVGLACGLTRRSSLFLAKSEKDVPMLRAEIEARREIGLEVEYLDGTALATRFAIPRSGAVLSRVAFQLDPWSFTKQLLVAAERLGARLFARTTLRPTPGDHLVNRTKTAIASRQITSFGQRDMKHPSSFRRSKDSVSSAALLSLRCTRFRQAGFGQKCRSFGRLEVRIFTRAPRTRAESSSAVRTSRFKTPQSETP